MPFSLCHYFIGIMLAIDFPGKKRIFMMNKTTSEIKKKICKKKLCLKDIFESLLKLF